MKLFCFIFFLAAGAHAQTILGHWQGSVNFQTSDQVYKFSCNRLFVDLIKNERGELILKTNYDCGQAHDWYIGDERTFVLDSEGNFLGEDGFIKDQEFFWNNSPAYQEGTKIHFALKDANTLGVDSTAPNRAYDGFEVSGVLQRVQTPMPEQKLWQPVLKGNWQGEVQTLVKDEHGAVMAAYNCHMNSWAVNDSNSLWFQNNLYLGDCDKSEIERYYGPFFFEYGKVWIYNPAKSGDKLLEVGTYTDKGFKVKYALPGMFDSKTETEVEVEILDENTLRLHHRAALRDMSLERTAIFKKR